MANISGHEVEISAKGGMIEISGSGAAAIHAELKPIVCDANQHLVQLSELKDDSFSFNAEGMLDSAVYYNHDHKDSKAFEMVSQIYDIATPLFTAQASQEILHESQSHTSPITAGASAARSA